MADIIPGRQTINVGVQNQATGSDDLYTAFTKVETNFENLFANASPYVNVNGGTGIIVTNPSSNSVSITNSGVTKLTSGTGITLNRSNGEVTISVSGSLTSVVAGVTNVGIRSTTLSISGSPIISQGVISIELPSIPTSARFNPGTYVSPTLTIDGYGRIVEISNISSAGTVTSVAVSAGEGISVSGSPIIDSGTINIINTGVTKLTAGPGISLSGSNGAVTISGVNPVISAVTRIDVQSTTLTVTGSPITSSGTISLELPNSPAFTKITAANIVSTGPIYGVNINASGNIVAIGDVSGNNFTVNGNLVVLGTTTTVNNETVNNSETITGNLTVSSNASVTGNLTVSTNAIVTGNIISGNANLGNLATANYVTINNNANVTANLKAGNANIVTTLTVGNITTTNGIFWANGAPYSPPSPNILMSSIGTSIAVTTTTATSFTVDGISGYTGNVLIYDSITVDTGSGYSTVNGKYTPAVSGYYQIEVAFSPTITGVPNANDGSYYFILLVKNGSTIIGLGNQIGGDGLLITSPGLLPLLAQSSINTIVGMNGTTDYLQVFLVAKINSGTFTTGATLANYLQAIWLRP